MAFTVRHFAQTTVATVVIRTLQARLEYPAAPPTQPFDLWGGASTSPLQPLFFGPSLLSVVSTSAQDGAAGTGALTVNIDGVDADYFITSETVTMDGVTPVVTTKQFLAINTVTVRAAGSTGAAVGTISVSTTPGALLVDVLQPRSVRAGTSHFVCPKEISYAIVPFLSFGAVSPAGNEIRGIMNLLALRRGSTTYTLEGRQAMSSWQGAVALNPANPTLTVIPGDVLKFRAESFYGNSGIIVCSASIVGD